MAARRLLKGALLALLAVGAPLACAYSPNPESGKLKCGRGQSCPEGYSCSDGQTCWRNTGSDAGRPPDGGGPDANPADKFIGHWVFGTGAMRVIACSDGSSSTMPVEDFVDVTAGTGGAQLRAEYFCFWNLDVTAAGNATVIRPGTTCTAADPSDPTMMYTWHGESFTLTTTNGRTGTLSASLPFEYTSTAGSGNCTMQYSAPLTKN